MKPIRDLILDLDGSVWPENYPFIGEPYPDAVEVLQEFHKRGGKIAVFTCREGQQRIYAEEALAKYRIPYDFFNENFPWRIKKYNGDCRKVSGDCIIDDLHIDFTGDWSKYRKILIDENPYFAKKSPSFALPRRTK